MKPSPTTLAALNMERWTAAVFGQRVIGAVRVEGECVSERRVFFISSSEDIAEFRRWVGDFPLVIYPTHESCHHFFESEFERIDAYLLAHILFPYQPDYRLHALAEALSLSIPEDRGILSDAEVVAALFPFLVRELFQLEPTLFDLLTDLMEGYPGVGSLIVKVREGRWGFEPLPGRSFRPSGNILGHFPMEPSESDRPVPGEEVEGFFEPGGPLSVHLPQYEMRPEQVAMAKCVAVSLHQDEFLVIEAGTGVGKTLAYLIPAILWSTRGPQRRVVLSTHTKTLQDQIFQKEIPLLLTLFGNGFRAVLLKGRGNYLCLRRWETLLARRQTLSEKERVGVALLARWAFETQDGDIEENGAFPMDAYSDLWSNIQADENHCQKSVCPYESQCFVQGVRRAAKNAHLLVVNHALLFADFLNAHAIFGSYDTLIIDEAHQLEKAATQHLAVMLHPGLFSESFRDLLGWVSRLEASLTDLPEKVNEKVTESLDTLRRTANRFSQEVSLFFQKLGESIRFHDKKSDARKVRLTENPFQSHLSEETGAVIERLGQIGQMVSGLCRELEEESSLFSDDPCLEMASFLLIERLVLLRKRIIHFAESDCHERVLWCEGDEARIVLFSVPLDVSSLLLESFYPSLFRCILTSATLTVAGRFDYFLSRLGLDRLDPGRVFTHRFDSPYDYRSQSLTLLPTYLPSPKEDAFIPAISELIVRVLKAHPRGTLVLFTSYQMLYAVYQRVRSACGGEDVVMFAQGVDGPNAFLLQRFREIRHSVLFGTTSFWEGIDVPGDALELLIITKIPFDVPTEPVFEARYAFVEEKTGNGFLHYAVPEAIIRFRQGYGRLIRSGSDRGAVLLLDTRVMATQYGRLLLASIPNAPVFPDSEERLLTCLTQWFEGAYSLPVDVSVGEEGSSWITGGEADGYPI